MAAREEIRQKQDRLRNFIIENKLSGVYIKRHGNFSWLTGGEIGYVNFDTELARIGLLLTPDKAYAVCNNTEAVRMKEEASLEDQGYEIRSFPWYSDREAEIVKKLGGPEIGADCGLSFAKDLSSAVTPLRYSLTSWEIERYKILAATAVRAAEEALRTVKRGDKECSVIGRTASRLWDERVDFVIGFCAADERIALFQHPVTSEKRIEKRVMLSVCARKGGLLVSVNRFAEFGKASEAFKKHYKDSVYIDCVMMAATIPGKPAAAAFQKGLEEYRKLGRAEEFELRHQGGPIGYAPREYRVTLKTPDLVLENQGFAWNPAIEGAKSEDTMLATSSGPIVLSEPILHPSFVVEAGGFKFRRSDILEL